jgi:hypothetical protein
MAKMTITIIDPDKLTKRELAKIMRSASREYPVRLPGGSIWTGMARADDPIYRNAGWNFLTGRQLNAHHRRIA